MRSTTSDPSGDTSPPVTMVPGQPDRRVAAAAGTRRPPSSVIVTGAPGTSDAASATQHPRRAEQALRDDHQVAGARVDQQRLGVGRSVGVLELDGFDLGERNPGRRRGLARLVAPGTR